MRRASLLGLVLVACTPSASDRGPPAKSGEQPSPKQPGVQPTAPASSSPSSANQPGEREASPHAGRRPSTGGFHGREDNQPGEREASPHAGRRPSTGGFHGREDNQACGQQIADYLAKRAELSHCASDSDCAEMWPGLCPHGPYYIHRDADAAAIIDLERTIMAGCEIPECEPPIELGIAHCEAGKCASGRTAPATSTHESCWDYRETWLEPDGAATATASSAIQGITPHVAIAPAAAGVLVLEVDWPVDCADCRLLISEHNSGMAKVMVAKSTRTLAERNGVPVVRDRLQVPVTPGPYHMVGMAGTETNYIIRADLRDAAGERGRVTRHGVGWQRMCEG